MLQLNDFKFVIDLINNIETKIKNLLDYKKQSELRINNLERRIKTLESEIRNMQQDFIRRK